MTFHKRFFVGIADLMIFKAVVYLFAGNTDLEVVLIEIFEYFCIQHRSFSFLLRGIRETMIEIYNNTAFSSYQ